MDLDDQESALAELAQASTAFSHETEENHGLRSFSKQLDSSGSINMELRGAGGAFDEYIDTPLPDAPTWEIPDTKPEKDSEEPTPLTTIGTSKLYELFGGDKPQDCEYGSISLLL